MKNRIICKINALASILSILIIFRLTFFTPICCDDLYFRKILANQDPLKFAISYVLHFDPRSLTPLAIITSFIYKTLSHPIALVFYNTVFLLTSFLLFKNFIASKIKSLNNIIGFTLFYVLIFYGLNVLTGEIFYWEAGAFYVLNLFFAVLWYLVWRKIIKYETSKLSQIIYWLLTILAGSFTYNLTIIILTFLALDTITTLNKRRKIINILSFLIINLIMVSIIMIPSSLNRTNFFELPLNKQIFYIFVSLIHIPKHYFKLSIPMILSMTLFSFILFLIRPKQRTDLKFKSWRDLIRFFTPLILALSSIAPFLIARHLASPRTALYFVLLVGFWWMKFSYELFNLLFTLRKPAINFANIIILLIFTIHIIGFADHYYIAYDITKQMKKRYELLAQAAKEGKQEVIVPKLNFQFVPFTLYYFYNNDLKSEPYRWQNTQMERVFGIKKIIAQ